MANLPCVTLKARRNMRWLHARLKVGLPFWKKKERFKDFYEQVFPSTSDGTGFSPEIPLAGPGHHLLTLLISWTLGNYPGGLAGSLLSPALYAHQSDAHRPDRGLACHSPRYALLFLLVTAPDPSPHRVRPAL